MGMLVLSVQFAVERFGVEKALSALNRSEDLATQSPRTILNRLADNIREAP